MRAFLRADLKDYCREAPQGRARVSMKPAALGTNEHIEFTDAQRNVFCVFSGTGVQGLRSHLNGVGFNRNPTDDDDDQTMITGPALTPVDDDDDNGDEGMDDADADPAGAESFGGGP